MKSIQALVQICLSSTILLALSAPAQVGSSTFTWTTNNGAITITGAATYPAVVIIPSSINGYPVTGIGANAFYVFDYYTPKITSVTIPDSVVSIGEFAFAQTALASVTIPNSVTNIGGGAFGGCLFLTNIAVAASNPACSSVNGVLFDKAQKTLIQFPGGLPGSYIIPNSVTNIGDYAFWSSDLTNVTIPDSVTRIGAAAFQMTGLNNVTIPDNVTSIGDYAFSETALKSLTIPSSVTNIGKYAFFYTSLTNVIISEGVISIGDYAFSDTSLTNVAIPWQRHEHRRPGIFGLRDSHQHRRGRVESRIQQFDRCPV